MAHHRLFVLIFLVLPVDGLEVLESGVVGLLVVDPNENFLIFLSDFLQFLLPDLEHGVDAAIPTMLIILPLYDLCII